MLLFKVMTIFRCPWMSKICIWSKSMTWIAENGSTLRASFRFAKTSIYSCAPLFLVGLYHFGVVVLHFSIVLVLYTIFKWHLSGNVLCNTVSTILLGQVLKIVFSLIKIEFFKDNRNLRCLTAIGDGSRGNYRKFSADDFHRDSTVDFDIQVKPSKLRKVLLLKKIEHLRSYMPYYIWK